MRIGTITFHWAANYGAVLQTYALQQYLIKCGFETEIIDYRPRRVQNIEMLENIINIRFNLVNRNIFLNKFRKNKLVISKQKYRNNKELFSCANKYDVVICGSDQIWNESFTLKAEKKITLSYFLNFAGPKTKRIGYAVSFGTDIVTTQYKDAVVNDLNKFSYIGVRENTGKEILSNMNIVSEVVCDPTLLLDREDYSDLIDLNVNRDCYFQFLLHKNQSSAYKVSDFLKKINPSKNFLTKTKTLEDWVSSIHNAEFVITNSFHCTMLALIFNIPFIVLPVEGMKMNNRIQTILDFVHLSDRFIHEYNEVEIKNIHNMDIDWNKVNDKISEIKISGRNFLNKSIND